MSVIKSQKHDVMVAISKKKRAIRIKRYNKNPRRCLICKAPIPYDKTLWANGGPVHCSQSCGSIAGNHKRALARGVTCCLHCKKPIVGKVYRLNLKYCTYKCYRLHQWKEFVKNLEEEGRIDDPRMQKKYLISKHGRQCMKCKRRKMNSNPIILEVHHKNHNHSDNRIENLLLWCPYCHFYHHRIEIWAGKRETYIG